MSKNLNTRDYLFDNYKALLIISVIVGHFIQPCYENNLLLYTIKYLIYAFHMPAFIFVSGYFSRKATTFGKAFQKIFIPYLCFQVTYHLYYTYIIGIDSELNLAYPKFSLWYLFALFVWKVATPYVKKVPHYFLWSVALGLLVGVLPIDAEFLSIGRIFAFYPYFLAGTLLDRELLTEARKDFYRVVSISGILIFTAFLIIAADTLHIPLSIFYGKTGYAQMNQGMLEGMGIRLLCYLVGFFFIYGIAILMPEKKTAFSTLGTATMPIYLFHGLTFKFFEHCTNLLEQVDSIEASVLLLGFCVLLAYLFSCKPFTKYTNIFSSFSLTKFEKFAERTYIAYPIEYVQF